MREWFVAHYEVVKDFAAPSVTVLGFVITTILAIAGFRTFGRWKREKIEEKRIEIAIDALAIGYEAKYVFEGIRSRFVRAQEQTGEQPGMSPERAQLIKSTESFHAVLKRLQSEREYFEKVWKLLPKVMAVFGGHTKHIFELLHKARNTVETTAEALLDEYRVELDPEDFEGRERRRKWRINVFASPGVVSEGDEVGRLLEEFEREIEKLCRPTVDKQYKTKSP